MTNYSEKLKALRGDKGITMVAAAVGVSASALSMYESGKRVPRDEVKIALSKYYGVSVGELFFNQK